MNFFIGVTDKDWFDYLSAGKPDEVNFWFPSPKLGFAALRFGEPFLFKLHHPLNFLVGGGYFVRYSRLPLSLAWEAFGDKNGFSDYDSCRKRIISYRKGESEPDPEIGCVILTSPFFFAEKDWIPVPKDWSSNIVRGKVYNSEQEYGKSAWMYVQERLAALANKEVIDSRPQRVIETSARYGTPQLIQPRLGQGGFRVLVTEAYQRRCAISGEKTLPVLTAAHIKSYAQSGPHEVKNGMLLRSDLHLLFDRGLLTVTPDLQVEVSNRIRDLYGNGKQYYEMHGRELISRPLNPSELPSREYLEWHNTNIYTG